MRYFKSDDGPFYKELKSGCLHIYKNNDLMNILDEQDWVDVKPRYAHIEISEKEFNGVATSLLNKLATLSYNDL